MLALGPERGTAIVTLGGGVVGDLGGFAASMLLRGVPFVQIPTTLLAQVDSAVGGKTGINTRHGKNLVGAFYQPKLVVADIDALDSLPRRQRLAGYAEVVKYGLLGDEEFFDWLVRHGADALNGDKAALTYAVRKSCEMKAAIVARDEQEWGGRALLNLGHTFGHALETATGYGDDLLHGEAVAIGMCMAFDLSAALGLCSVADAARVRCHLSEVGLATKVAELNTAVAWEPAQLLATIGHDKKVRDGRPTYVLVKGIGQAFTTQDIAPEAVEKLLAEAIAA
ncbi:MAG: 3-dehydroquinate synthase, partial [Alphaproteobacteria bacterium]